MIKGFTKCVVILSTLIVSGCASATTCAQKNDNQEKVSALESYNQVMFDVNHAIEKSVIRPVAKGYKAITNKFIRQRVTNFFNNIGEPVSAANHILQGEPANLGKNLSRFVINTTAGGLGLFDVATKWGVEAKPTGFDETLATWCVPDGPFIVLPIIGPSTPRAATGFAVDGYSSPIYWVAHENHGKDAMWAYYGATGLKYVNLMAENMEILESLEEGSVDYYETIKSTYLQNRTKIGICGKTPDENSQSYDFDMDMDED